MAKLSRISDGYGFAERYVQPITCAALACSIPSSAVRSKLKADCQKLLMRHSTTSLTCRTCGRSLTPYAGKLHSCSGKVLAVGHSTIDESKLTRKLAVSGW
jgi:hypothetical protein